MTPHRHRVLSQTAYARAWRPSLAWQIVCLVVALALLTGIVLSLGHLVGQVARLVDPGCRPCPCVVDEEGR